MDIVSEKSSVSLTAIHKLVDDYQTTGSLSDVVHPDRHRGRPPSLDEEEKKKIIGMAMEIGDDGYKKYSTVKEIKNELELNVHPRTLSRAVVEDNIHGRVRRCAHPLTEANRKERLSFARSLSHWTVDDWSKVLFSDETQLPSSYSSNQQWCLRHPHEEWLKENTKPDKKRPPSFQLNAWGCIAASGVGELHLTQTTFTGASYLVILKDNLFKSKHNLNLSDDWNFLQDNARPHIESSVERWLYRNHVPLLQLPANSPDLNPIELIWGEIKKFINKKFPKSTEELRKAAKEAWSSLSSDFIRHCINDMPRRIQAVITNNGNRIG